MNYRGLKTKSFFYSLAIHGALALVVLGVYLREDEKHEVYSLINLSKIHLCTPCVKSPVKKVDVKRVKKLKEKKEVKKVIKKATKKVVKPTIKPVTTKKIVVVKSKPLKEFLVVEKDKVEKELVVVQEDKVEKIEKELLKEKVSDGEEVAVEVENAPVMAVSEPKLTYEAQYMQDNIALINALIKKNLNYPRLAKKRGLQGKAMVSFTLNLKGQVLDIQAIGLLSSILKKAAIKTVKKASKGFPHPSQVLALRIPIVYKLH